MKKKIVCLIAALTLCFCYSVNAFAATVGQTGQTSGGDAGILNCYASLTVNTYYASASTGINSPPSVNPSSYSLATTVIIYYTNTNYQSAAASASGTSSATIANPGLYTSDVRATSSHRVSGPTWGIWECSLSANAN
jgi:hypothetical protein